MSKKLPSVTVNRRTLAMILVREYNIREGEWQVGTGFAMDAGFRRLGPANELMPTFTAGVQNIVLFRVAQPSDISVSAEAVNLPKTVQAQEPARAQ